MSYSFTKRNQSTELYCIVLYLDGKLFKSYYCHSLNELNSQIDALISKFPEHNKKFEFTKYIEYKPMLVKGENL